MSIVNDDNYNNFIQREGDNYKILLFTERKSTAPLFKSLSKKYKGKLVFGEVRKSSESKLIEDYGIKKFPTMIVVQDPFSFEKDVYEDDMNADRLSLFLGKYAYKKKQDIKKIEWVQLNHKTHSAGLCAKKNAQNCFIVCSKNLAESKPLKDLPEIYKNDKIVFAYYSGASESACSS